MKECKGFFAYPYQTDQVKSDAIEFGLIFKDAWTFKGKTQSHWGKLRAMGGSHRLIVVIEQILTTKS